MYDFVDQKRVVYITLAIILLISAVIAPVAIFYPLKAAFITPSAEAIGTSYVSMITGGAGIALLAVGLIILAILEMRLKKYLLSGVMFLAGIFGIALSLGDYYYMTKDHFTYNAPFSFEQQNFEWQDFEKIEEYIGTKDGVNSLESVILYPKDGDAIEMSSGQILQMSGSIANRIENAGGQYERISSN